MNGHQNERYLLTLAALMKENEPEFAEETKDVAGEYVVKLMPERFTPAGIHSSLLMPHWQMMVDAAKLDLLKLSEDEARDRFPVSHRMKPVAVKGSRFNLLWNYCAQVVTHESIKRSLESSRKTKLRDYAWEFKTMREMRSPLQQQLFDFVGTPAAAAIVKAAYREQMDFTARQLTSGFKAVSNMVVDGYFNTVPMSFTPGEGPYERTLKLHYKYVRDFRKLTSQIEMPSN